MPIAPSKRAASEILVRTKSEAQLQPAGRIPKDEVDLPCSKLLSDAGVPGIASFWRRGAQTFAETFQIVSDRQVGDELHVLLADLSRNPQAKRPAVAY